MKPHLLLMTLLFTLLTLAATAAERPNIVFILADDLGWRDLSGEGSTYYESPHIDSIAKGGMRFTRGYAACQVCSPSRAIVPAPSGGRTSGTTVTCHPVSIGTCHSTR